MDDVVDPSHGQKKPVLIKYVSKEEAQGRALEVRVGLHLRLLQFITGIYDQPVRTIPLQDHLDEFLAEGTSSARDQYRFVIEHV